MALPMLESLAAEDSAPDSTAKRLVCIGGYLGFHQKSIYPRQAGRDL